MIDPENYLTDAQGRLVPRDSIKAVDLARHQLVGELAVRARELRASLARFRADVIADILAFAELSAEKYGVKRGGRKGNLTLTSYDGEWKIILAVQETLHFDERIQAAKTLIDQCLTDWSKDARPELRTLIADAFAVDKTGKINTGRVLSLRRLDFDDARWRGAMEAISDSLSVAVSRTYVRFYQRDDTGDYTQIPLDLANA